MQGLIIKLCFHHVVGWDLEVSARQGGPMEYENQDPILSSGLLGRKRSWRELGGTFLTTFHT